MINQAAHPALDNSRLSMDSPEWYTPACFADAAREVFGGAITLDPASHPEANEIVGAVDYYTEGMNGLLLPWRGNVFVNPPGGLVGEFWNKLVSEFVPLGGVGAVDQAIWIGYSVEQLQTLQRASKLSPLVLASAICFPNRRIAFVENEAKRAARHAKLAAQGKRVVDRSQPSHANYIAYLGPNERRFQDVFGKFGACR